MNEQDQPIEFAGSLKRLARSLLATGRNRIELLMVELQEERAHLLQLVLLGVGLGILALLSGMAISAAIAVYFWQTSPAGVLLALGLLYAFAGYCLYRRLSGCVQTWKSFRETGAQFEKDRVWMEKTFD